MLSEADRNGGRIRGDKDLISRSLAWVSLSNRPETQVKHVRYALDYMEERGWIRADTDSVLVCKYSEYHPTRGKNKSHEGVIQAPTTFTSFTNNTPPRRRAKKNGAESPPPASPTRFQLPESVVVALDRTAKLGRVPKLRTAAWWQAVVRAFPEVDHAAEVMRAEAHLVVNPHYKDLSRFLYNWIKRKAAWQNSEEA